MKSLLAVAVLVLTMVTAVRASDLPEPSAIKGNDLVVATKDGESKAIPGYITVTTCFDLILQRSKTDDKTPLKIPAGAILYAFFEEANNEVYIDGLKAYEARKYDEALDLFDEAAGALNSFSVAARRDLFVQYLNFYRGMCKFRLGDFKGAVDSFDLSLRPKDPVFKYQGEYFSARSYEGLGDYERAESKYGQLVNSVYPKLLERAPWGQRWLLLARLGQQRASLQLNAQRDGQEANVIKARDGFETVLREFGDKIDDEVKSDALLVRVGAEKYLAKKNPEKYAEVVKLLEKPVREAVTRNDRAALAWMYSDMADAYYGMLEVEKDAAKKKELAEKTRFEYMRIWMTTNASPANLCKAYYRTGKLCEMLKDKDWALRALQAYRHASNPRFKGQLFNEDATAAVKAMEAVGEKPAGK